MGLFLMVAAASLLPHPVLLAMEQAPPGEPFTPEQEAELAQDVADMAAGRARLVAHEDLPSVLDEIRRARRG
jgi:hypothetical protein